jgi:hypothetical protein
MDTTIDQLLAEYGSDDEQGGGGRGGSIGGRTGRVGAGVGGFRVGGKSIEDILREAEEEEDDDEGGEHPGAYVLPVVVGR